MPDDLPDPEDGANPADDIRRRNPDGTMNDDQAGNAADDRSGEASDDPDKVEELAKAGREHSDTDKGQA